MSPPTGPRYLRRDLLPRSAERRSLGSRTARRIEEMIIESGWAVGTVLGSEAELTARLGVGRSVLREAVRLLEAEGVARRRPGPGGGLVVTAPDADAVLGAARLFLDYRGVRSDDLFDVWLAVELAAVSRLATTIDPEGAARLRTVLADGLLARGGEPAELPNVHVEIARLSGNPAAELFLGVVIDLCLEHGIREIEGRDRAWLDARHTEIVEAVVSGDGALAQQAVRRYIARLSSWGALPGRARPPQPCPSARPAPEVSR
ncbi:GntR family transcriptional regulator [Spirillospora sp. NPDC046719]